MPPIYSIGHSTRPIGEFIRLLEETGVDFVADVRTVPKSRFNPQFNADALAEALAAHSIGYCRIPELGGLRGPRKDGRPSPNGFWENENFKNYADYAGTPPFWAGLRELRDLGRSQTCAMMCAESLWWQCHRRIIVDYLLAAGETVAHIVGEGKLEPARMTEAAVVGRDGVITYPPVQASLF
jgi:uncharacterized protein (DUF488 family)